MCEYNYAQSLKASIARDKQRSISVEMPKPNNENTALQLLDKALKKISKAKRDKNPYDIVWIFFDNDNQPNLARFFQKLNRIKTANIQIAYSSLCIEHWFIIHFENNRKKYKNAHRVEQDLNNLWLNRFERKYHKTRINHFEKLKDSLPKAIEIASEIKRQSEADKVPVEKRNPYFTVHEFIRFFQNL